MSYAEICRAVDESIKDEIMHDQTKLQRAELGRALEECRFISAGLAQNNKQTLKHDAPNHR